MSKVDNINLKENVAVSARRDHYLDIQVSVEKVLKSWQRSVFSYEWMLPDGRIKAPDELPEKEQAKRQDVEEALKKGSALEKPVLGIGLMENIEIGSNRAVFLTLAAHGIKSIDVHIPKSNSDEFQAFLA